MEQEEYVFTPEDWAILHSYETVMDGLAAYLGDGFEIVLHSLEDRNRSVMKIINGHYTGRKEGAPMTDYALSMLNQIRDEHAAGYCSYYSRNRKGEPLKSTTITIRNSGQRVIGMLCLNFYLNTPLSRVLETFGGVPQAHPAGRTEIFADNTDELVRQSVLRARAEVEADSSITPSNRNREIVNRLWKANVFTVKDAVALVAGELDISVNTVYLHLRNLRHSSG